ncbi:MAG: hypothetical protein V3W41_20335 [Planctomycetota bacterium]
MLERPQFYVSMLLVAAFLGFTATSNLTLLSGATQNTKRQQIKSIPKSKKLAKASDDYLAVFEVRDDKLVGKHLRVSVAGRLGLQCWERMTTLFPLSYRKLIVQFNVMKGKGAAGRFSGNGSNDVGRKGFRISIARYLLEKSKATLKKRSRPVTARRGTLDWTLVSAANLVEGNSAIYRHAL